MKLTFLGTRGYIEAKSRRHRRHSALLIEYYHTRVMIDCGADWLGRLARIDPDAVVVTHAHPDHAWGLKQGAPCPVYATAPAREAMADYPGIAFRDVAPRTPFEIGSIIFEAYPVTHSLRAPAVGYRISAGRARVFYVPDVVDIDDRDEALADLDIFIGDGASVSQPLVRRKGDKIFGHTTIRAQLGWCAEADVGLAMFTHCGSEIVAGDERSVGARVRRMAKERGVAVEIAHDGQEKLLR